MEMKLAVATNDGIHINEHFGRASRFMIYGLRDERWEYLEDRETLPPCSGHEHTDRLLEQAADLIADCQGVVVYQLGPTAVDVLISRRVLPFMMSGSIERALETLKESRRFNRSRAEKSSLTRRQ